MLLEVRRWQEKIKKILFERVPARSTERARLPLRMSEVRPRRATLSTEWRQLPPWAHFDKLNARSIHTSLLRTIAPCALFIEIKIYI